MGEQMAQNQNAVRDWLNKKWWDLRMQFGNRCEMCGDPFGLEFAHLVPTKRIGLGRGKKAQYYDIKNHPDAYMLLCKRCHKKIDRPSEQEKKVDYYLDPEHIINRIIQ